MSAQPGLVPMMPDTAVAFVLLGLTLWLRPWNSPLSRGLAWASVTIVTVIALLTLAEYAGGWNFGIDELIFREPDPAGELRPGRMAVATATGLLLAAAALVLSDFAARHPPAGALARLLSWVVVG